MIICSCNEISDSDLSEAVEAGNDTCRDIMDYLGFDFDCESCWDTIEQIIKETER